MSDRDDTRDTRGNTRESGSMFDPRAERADTHTRGAPTGLAIHSLLHSTASAIHFWTHPRR